MRVLIKNLLILLLTLFLIFFVSLNYSFSILNNLENGFDPVDIINVIEKGYTRVFDYTAVFLKQEFLGGKLLPLETIEFKFRKPGDIYMKWSTSPNKGQEVLYRNAENKIKVHKGGILGMVSFYIDPRGSLAMKNQHHPINDAGIGSTIAIVKRCLQTGLMRGELTIEYKEEVSLDNRKTVVLEAEFPKRCEGVKHIVGKDENIWDIAKKYNQDMYVIIHNNENIKTSKDIKNGLEILIPYHYCQRIIVYLDKELSLLVKLEIFDWNGNLYETYQYEKLKINVGLTENDFSPHNPQYNF